MKIRNNIVLIFVFISFLLGLFDGSVAYDEEIERILNYSTNYEYFTKNITLYFYLVFRYLKYILLILFFTVGYFGKVTTVLIAMVKSYSYSFTATLIIITFSGIELVKKLMYVGLQMTISLLLTILVAQIAMNYLQDKYSDNKKHKILVYTFVFSLICCIIIGIIDLLIIWVI